VRQGMNAINYAYSDHEKCIAVEPAMHLKYVCKYSIIQFGIDLPEQYERLD
jgi:hypothetical protein